MSVMRKKPAALALAAAIFIIIAVGSAFGVDKKDKPEPDKKESGGAADGGTQIGGTVVGGEVVKWPLAVPEFKVLGQTPDNDGLAKLGANVLANDLSISGVFEVLDPKSYLEDAKKGGLTEASVNFNDWLNVGANALIKAGVTIDGENVKLDIRLFDVVTKKMVLGKEYKSVKSQYRYMIHKFASEVLSYFTKGAQKGIYNTKIACVKKTETGKELWIMDFDGAGAYPLTNNGSLNLLPSWDAGGKGIFFTSYVGGDPDVYSAALGKSDNLVRITTFPGLEMNAVVSPDGKRIALVLTKDDNAEIYVMNRDGSNLTRLTNSWGIDVSPSWSPDGKKIAFVSNRSGNPHIYIMNADGSNQDRLTFVGSYNQSPVWSPKGDVIAFVGRDERYIFDIFTISVTDKLDIKRLTQDMGNNESPSWSPDAKHIVFASDRSGESKLYIMNADGSNQRKITMEKGEYATPAWSPNMSWD